MNLEQVGETPALEIVSRMGTVVRPFARIGITEIWALRLSDWSLRRYFLSDLRANDPQAMVQLIATLPQNTPKKARAYAEKIWVAKGVA